MQEKGILLELLRDPRLGSGHMRGTAALAKDNAYFVAAFVEML